jgi:3',5'-cyclic AMP phosphodiesterase CpdA
MKTIAHISDVHFGREDPEIVAGLLASVERAAPDLVVVSGDLTQRAKKRQFRAARAFLRELPEVPRIVVPGNHDVSATNLFERAIRPLARYKRYITDDMNPFYEDGEVAVAGINTVRIAAVKDGRLNLSQVRTACEQLGSAGAGSVRIVVTHHPIDTPAEDERHTLVHRAVMAMQHFSNCRVDMFLSGHFHAGLALVTSARYKFEGYSAVVVHAGTAASTRTRGETNSWNRIAVGAGTIEIQQMIWSGKKFEKGENIRYERCAKGWRLAV